MNNKIFMFLIFLILVCTKPVLATTNVDSIKGKLTIVINELQNRTSEKNIPIKNSRVIIINDFGEIVGDNLTNSLGEVTFTVDIPRDNRFHTKALGNVTVIAVASGFNEFIDFNVPINEHSGNTTTRVFSLWKIDSKRRNEPQFINGSYHRFTVFEMLDDYALNLGLRRQIINDPTIDPAPWGPKNKKDM